MAFVSSASDMLLNAEELEVRGRVGILRRRIPFVGPGHGDGHGVARLDADVQVAASGCRMVNTTTVQAGRLHGNSFAVCGSPVEDTIILGIGDADQNADEQRGEDGKVLHTLSICRAQAGA